MKVGKVLTRLRRRLSFRRLRNGSQKDSSTGTPGSNEGMNKNGKECVLRYTSGPTIKTNPFSLNPFAAYDPFSEGENKIKEKPTSPYNRNPFREIPPGYNNPFSGNPFVEDCDFFMDFNPRGLEFREIIAPVSPWKGQPDGWAGDQDGWASFEDYDPVQVLSQFGPSRDELIEDMKVHSAAVEKGKILLDEIEKYILG